MDTDFEDDETEPKRTDPGALQILAMWIARHDGFDPITGAIFDREFVLVDVPTMSAHRLA